MNSVHERILRYFKYKHLPAELQAISKPCCELAEQIVEEFCKDSIDPSEVTVGLRKLMEAKDCFVRAMLK